MSAASSTLLQGRGEDGLIFGKHDYRDQMRKAGNLPGTQFMAGHKHTTTTARYVKPSLRAAEAMLEQTAKPARRARAK